MSVSRYLALVTSAVNSCVPSGKDCQISALKAGAGYSAAEQIDGVSHCDTLAHYHIVTVGEDMVILIEINGYVGKRGITTHVKSCSVQTLSVKRTACYGDGLAACVPFEAGR